MTPKLLFHLSDLHFGLEDREALSWAARLVEEERPDAVVITGDLTMRARPREFAAAARWIGSLGVPVSIGVGNHDMPYFNPVERFVAPYRRFGRMQDAVSRTIGLSFDGAVPGPVPGLAVVPLRTAPRAQWRLNWSKGWITRGALRSCLSRIDALPAGTRALVAAHHPLRETGTQGTALTRGGGRALEELAARNVVAVLSGHVHDAFDIAEPTPRGPVRMIGAGTLSHRTRATPPGFNALRWDGDRLDVEVRSFA